MVQAISVVGCDDRQSLQYLHLKLKILEELSRLTIAICRPF